MINDHMGKNTRLLPDWVFSAEDLVNSAAATEDERAAAAKLVENVSSVNDYLGAVADWAGKLGLAEALEKNLPWWATAIGQAAGPVTAAISAFTAILGKALKEKSAEKLGLIACTVAYQKAAAEAVRLADRPGDRVPLVNAKNATLAALGKIRLNDPSIIRGLSLRAPWAHPFVTGADASFLEVVRLFGYNEREWREFQEHVHFLFAYYLGLTLTDGKYIDKFAPFRELLKLEAHEVNSLAAIRQHAAIIKSDFETGKVLNREPFPLKDIYVRTTCEVVQWSVLNGRRRNRPTAAEQANRTFSDLLDSVLGLIGDKNYTDPIVVEGGPGSGKSSFTHFLAVKLLEEKLCPILVRLRNVDVDLRTSTAVERIAEAVLRRIHATPGIVPPVLQPSDLFLNQAVLADRTVYRGAEICRYVFILDGWDEIGHSINEAQQLRVHRFMEAIRKELASRITPIVRVVVTGRPSEMVESSPLLTPNTRVLLLQPLTPIQLRHLVEGIGTALKNAVPQTWLAPSDSELRPLLQVYESEYEKPRDRKLDVLGWPLLTLLVLYVMSRVRMNPAEVARTPTTLYRHLTDLVSPNRGSAEAVDLPPGHITGDELRERLRQIALAIAAYGNDVIPKAELEKRLAATAGQLERITEAGDRYTVADLLVSYYFKHGNSDLGCEFSHKSFREYLAAEGIVETLKAYGRNQRDRPDRRKPYWADFPPRHQQPDDHRQELAWALISQLGLHWLQPEVARHVEDLMSWEVGRACGRVIPAISEGKPTEQLTFGQWEQVRDALADLWDWWAEGVHLRPLPEWNSQTHVFEFTPSKADTLAQRITPWSWDMTRKAPTPGRTVRVDSQFGDALFFLTAVIHFEMATQSGWSGTMATEPMESRSEYQVVVGGGDRKWTLFKPAGDQDYYWDNYVARINAAGFRPGGRFPGLAFCKGIQFPKADLWCSYFSGARLDHANFSGAYLSYCDFAKASMRSANLGFYARLCSFKNCDMSDSHLTSAQFEMCVQESDQSDSDQSESQSD